MKLLASGVAALVLAASGSASAATNIWSTSFDSGYFETLGPFPWSLLTVKLGGADFAPAESFPGFGTRYFRNPTAGVTIFTAAGLGAHTDLHLSFDLAFIDSWDGFDASNGFGPDLLSVNIDGVAPLSLTWNGGGGNGPLFGPGTVVGTGNYGVSFWNDAVVHYDFVIPHTASTWSMSIGAGGAGWQGGADESWGIDNFHLGATAPAGVPEPASWTMMILGFGLAGALVRRQRRAVALISAPSA